jgi:hypothetical protein
MQRFLKSCTVDSGAPRGEKPPLLLDPSYGASAFDRATYAQRILPSLYPRVRAERRAPHAPSRTRD